MSVRLLTIAAIATFLSSLALAQSKGVGMSAREPGRRLALVIGNSAYETGPLRNPVNDARDMASALEAVGFRVTLLTDAEHQRMEEAIDAFGLALRPEDVGLFYYSGHGVQVRGENYLIPVDANPKRATVLKFEAVNAARVLGMMEAAGNRLNLVILDACRNNPFRGRFRSLDPGLARMDAPTGTLVAYATAPGQVAEDGAGRNSPYTGALLRHLPTPGLKVEDFFKRVRADVERATRKAQVPWEATSLKGDFYFAGLGGAGPAALTAPPAAASAPGLPTNPEAARLLRMGRLFRERSRPQKALESFETLVREHAGTAEALDGNAELLELLIAREGLTHSVEDRLTEFEARHPGAPQVARVREQAAQWLVEQGGSATAAGKAEEAETLFGKAFSYGADGGAVREKRIEGLIAAGRLEQAEEALVAWLAEGRAAPRAAALMRSLDGALRQERQQRTALAEAVRKQIAAFALDKALERIAAETTLLGPKLAAALRGEVEAARLWRDPLTGMEFVPIPGGSYEQGCGSWTSHCDDDEKPTRRVTLSPFWLGKTEVTQRQWKRVMGNYPSRFQGDDRPVEQVSWNDTQEFIRRLNAQSRGVTFRLPSEAEWEYACRSGGKSVAYGTDSGALERGNANYDQRGTTPVTRYPPNAVGLHDMTGNVWEWTQDVFSAKAYQGGSTSDPIHLGSGARRVYRDGGWSNRPRNVRCSNRGRRRPTYRSSSLGFRLVRTP